MEKLKAKLAVGFSTKVLLPVVTIMVLLLAITVWLVNRRITQQYQMEAARNLRTADLFFRNARKVQRKNLVLRFRNLPNEPRYRASFQSFDHSTLNDLFGELVGELNVDIIMFTTEQPEVLAHAKRDLLISIEDFNQASSLAVSKALRGDAQVDTVRVGDRLFDVVSIPVPGMGGHLIGALTLGSEIGSSTVQEFSLLSENQIVLLARDKVMASTAGIPELHCQFARLFNSYFDPTNATPWGAVNDIVLQDRHYYYSAGKFESLSVDDKPGYLLLSPYEGLLRSLKGTQQMLLSVSALGILLGTGAVWIFIRRITQPLRALSQSAEAVGRGDFSRRVEVTSRDECGELAAAFNQMTENLKRSREQLESTVQTLKTTQAQLIQSEKLSGIGEFVAGVAHELNNPLTAVMGFSELLERADTEPGHKRYLEMIRKSSQRCQKIVQSLLSFARRHAPERKLFSVNELMENAVEFLQYQLRTSNIEVILRLAPDLPRAMVDPHQIQQVFLNLINNARQAIEGHQPRGSIRITTETSGPMVRITLEDDGPGIAEANLSKVFDPFFTTKEVGKGTGLGLSLCYGMIKEHGGSIEVRSRLGEGATFIIELPLAREGEPLMSKPEAPIPQVMARREGVGKKVLIIDDEESILQMVRDTLSEHGYQVDVARDGEAALRNANRVAYDLALCDWKMPGLNGEQVYERLQTLNPALSERMIFITGDVINDKAQKFLRERNKVCLSKPFSLAEFRAAIGKALGTS
jgi:signal transduction histidine kinase/CheY-like chemotaxis protein